MHVPRLDPGSQGDQTPLFLAHSLTALTSLEACPVGVCLHHTSLLVHLHILVPAGSCLSTSIRQHCLPRLCILYTADICALEFGLETSCGSLNCVPSELSGASWLSKTSAPYHWASVTLQKKGLLAFMPMPNLCAAVGNASARGHQHKSGAQPCGRGLTRACWRDAQGSNSISIITW